nr:uncharacterized protein LOC124810256 [Hydra vulgaris]
MSSFANSLNSLNDEQWQVLITDLTNDTNVGPICENNTPCGGLYCRDVCLSNNSVHAYVCLATNDVAKIATPSLSSTYSSSYVARYAIDGDLSTVVSTNFAGNYKWFKLDLKLTFLIYQIILWNNSFRPLGLKNSKLFVSLTDQLPNYYQISILSSEIQQTFTGSYNARYIIITKDFADALQLADISVFV